MQDELEGLDATAQADLVRRNEISALELVERAIAHIVRLNPQLNAVIHTRFDAARDEARDVMPGSAAPVHAIVEEQEVRERRFPLRALHPDRHALSIEHPHQ